MKNAGELLASLGGLGGITATLKWIQSKLAGKANQQDVDELTTRLDALEERMSVQEQQTRELRRILFGSDEELDEGLLPELQATLERIERQNKSAKRERKELATRLTDLSDNDFEIDWRNTTTQNDNE